MDVAHHWAQAIWNQWLPPDTLQRSIDHARPRLANTTRPWSIVYGPAAALICTLERIGWEVVSATELNSDQGKYYDLTVDPPIVTKRAVEAAVRK